MKAQAEMFGKTKGVREMKYSATYKDGVYIAESVKAHANEAERTAYVRTRPYTVKVTAKCARYLMSKAGK